MPCYDFRAPRLYVDAPLRSGAELAVGAAPTHYLRNVLRLKSGDPVLVFNGREGEWRATLGGLGKRAVSLAILDRMKANAIEAAEQCGILTLPEIAPAVTFDEMLVARDPARLLVFCDEDAEVSDPIAALMPHRTAHACPLAVLIGPEGGFAEHERAALVGLPNVVRISLGPQILRADTAAVAALALVGAVLGDWR